MRLPTLPAILGYSAITASYFAGFVLAAAVLAALPIIAYAVLVVVGGIFYDDVGGILSFVFVPLFSLLWGVVGAALLTLIVALFHLLSRRQSWVLAFAPLLFLPLVVGVIAWFTRGQPDDWETLLVRTVMLACPLR